ncbi:hypothetical protein SVAN01_06520 [Stagonosporopsis vannaccii]|nr:hypothetical protein SVAN01_06520 [Stagonosporopsis vannaccii]
MPLASVAASDGVEDKPALCDLHDRERLPAVAQSGTTTLSSTAYVNIHRDSTVTFPTILASADTAGVLEEMGQVGGFSVARFVPSQYEELKPLHSDNEST